MQIHISMNKKGFLTKLEQLINRVEHECYQLSNKVL
jgi:hypothetical protein